MKDVLDILKSLSKEIGIIVFVWLISLVFSKYSCQVVKTSQMEPRLKVESIRIIKKVYSMKQLNYGDIVAYIRRDPQTTEEVFWGRIIAKENDRLTIKDNKIFVNNQQITESYLSEEPKKMPDILNFIIPNNCLFVLNDTRNDDYAFADSLQIGPIHLSTVIGKLSK